MIDNSEEKELVEDLDYPRLGSLWRTKKMKLFLSIFLGILVIVWINNDNLSHIVAEKLVQEKENKTFNVLFWIAIFFDYTWYTDKAGTLNSESLKAMNCPVTNCFFTHNQNHLKNLTDFDVILFHSPQKISDNLPNERTPEQLYVFMSLEPPQVLLDDLHLFNNFYNLTLSYRMDSDFTWFYTNIYDLQTNETVAPALDPKWKMPDEDFYDEAIMEVSKNKTKSIAWFVSRCNPPNKRLELAKKLQEYIDVDIYGKCGTLTCAGDCDDLLGSNYKFYLAFENSLCHDYVTEKPFRALGQQVIPILYNGANESRFFPPKSYINANDFFTVEDLAKYLHYLIDNPKEYVKYFWWKKHYRIQDQSKNMSSVTGYQSALNNIRSGLCELCVKLNDDNFRSTQHEYKNIYSWWSDFQCDNEAGIKI